MGLETPPPTPATKIILPPNISGTGHAVSLSVNNIVQSTVCTLFDILRWIHMNTLKTSKTQ